MFLTEKSRQPLCNLPACMPACTECANPSAQAVIGPAVVDTSHTTVLTHENISLWSISRKLTSN